MPCDETRSRTWFRFCHCKGNDSCGWCSETYRTEAEARRAREKLPQEENKRRCPGCGRLAIVDDFIVEEYRAPDG
jgi:hypothetical protein